MIIFVSSCVGPFGLGSTAADLTLRSTFQTVECPCALLSADALLSVPIGLGIRVAQNREEGWRGREGWLLIASARTSAISPAAVG